MLYSSNGGTNFGSIKGNITESGGITKFFQDPVNSATIYVGYKNIWKSVNRGSSWTIISNFTWSKTTAFAVAKSNTSIIYAANGASMQKTTDGGANWSAIGNSLPTNASISDITIDNLDPNKAWITYSGYSVSTKVFFTSNGGTTWTNITFSLPNVPINCIIKDNTTTDEIYIGTDIGMYIYNSSLSGWQAFSTGLPNMEVTQLAINYTIKKIRASSAGRGLWESPLNSEVTTSLSDYNLLQDARVFPNPNDGHFTLEMNVLGNDKYVIEVYNIVGKLIYSEPLGDFKGEYRKQIDLTSYGQGVYVVTLKNACSNESVKKIVVY
ncbi:MAG: T9SS type A sorting domain-containing protein [Bacteroidetes bacterium]|nr:T9SS type A sorting domain-containing protein [Bacteroidota bacterium]